MFDIKVYLQKIGVQPGKNESAKELLFAIVKAHVQTFHFQNIDLYLECRKDVAQRKPFGLTPDDVFQTLVVEERCGGCYQLHELLFHVLQRLGFAPFRFMARVLKGRPFNPDDLPCHNLLYVNLEGEEFLIDVGFAENSLREPLPFKASDTFAGSRKLVIADDYYCIVRDVVRNEYCLYVNRAGGWMALYQFAARHHKLDSMLEYIEAIFTDPRFIPIRDKLIKCTVITDTERKNFTLTSMDEACVEISRFGFCASMLKFADRDEVRDALAPYYKPHMVERLMSNLEDSCTPSLRM